MDAAMATVPHTGRRPQTKNLARITIDLTIKTLIGQGLSVRQIADTLKCSPSTVQRVRDGMKAIGQEPEALVSASRNAQLGKVYDHFLKKGLKIQKVRASDVVAVAKDYRSVAYPTRAEGLPPTYQFVQINLNEASPRNEPLDISPGAPSTTRGSVSDLGKSIMDEFLNDSDGCSVR
jgi:hypothetical protein